MGRDAEAENLRILGVLAASRAAIEVSYGDELEWQSLEGRRACRIRQHFDGGYRDERLPEIQDRMIRLEQALRPAIDQLEM